MADLWRPIENGSNTQYRLGVIESLLPPKTDGPVFHFHEMHDEGFYVTVSPYLTQDVVPTDSPRKAPSASTAPAVPTLTAGRASF